MPRKKNKKNNNYLKIIGIVSLCVIFVLICFLISNNNSEEYSKHSVSTSDTSEEDTLEIITKEAGEVSDDERKKAKEISLDDYFDLKEDDSYSLILLSRPTCQYCKIATPILENIIYKYDVLINYINTDELDQDDNKELMASDEHFSEGYGTPLLFVVKDDKVVDTIDGLVGRDNYIDFMKKYEFIK